jgi:hypothetical protein
MVTKRLTGISDRIAIARQIIDHEPILDKSTPSLLKTQSINWPKGLEPISQPIASFPTASAALPKADCLVVTWTIAEVKALADVLTPGYPSKVWYNYSRDFVRKYKPEIRNGAPSLLSNRLGSYFLTMIAGKKVLLFKSELHLNQDGKAQPKKPGIATLSVKKLWKQLIKEVNPSLVITTGTAGATMPDHELGDVIVSTSAKFRLQMEFCNAPFNGKIFNSPFVVPTKFITVANQMIALNSSNLQEPDFGPPTKKDLPNRIHHSGAQ